MSQGSEFDTVIVSLTPGTRLISQELLYTAVTRAKKKIIIVATKDDFLSAVTTPARRLTGLREMLIN
jgi:exodeoxyribonuclease V alpha subunit